MYARSNAECYQSSYYYWCKQLWIRNTKYSLFIIHSFIHNNYISHDIIRGNSSESFCDWCLIYNLCFTQTFTDSKNRQNEWINIYNHIHSNIHFHTQ
jgi:hypothetical protein